MMTPVMTSGIGGQPGTLTTGVLPVKFVMPEDPVGFGLAAWMPPETAQVP